VDKIVVVDSFLDVKGHVKGHPAVEAILEGNLNTVIDNIHNHYNLHPCL